MAFFEVPQPVKKTIALNYRPYTSKIELRP